MSNCSDKVYSELGRKKKEKSSIILAAVCLESFKDFGTCAGPRLIHSLGFIVLLDSKALHNLAC